MRSRNGNRPFILTNYTLIFTLALCADNYYIGYRLSVKNSQPIYEKIFISKAMQPCTSPLSSSQLILHRNKNESIQAILEKEKAQFIEFTMNKDFYVKNNETYHIQSTQIHNELTIPMECYAVEFNDEFVTITSTK